VLYCERFAAMDAACARRCLGDDNAIVEGENVHGRQASSSTLTPGSNERMGLEGSASMKRRGKTARSVMIAALCAILSLHLGAQATSNVVSIDATAPPIPPQPIVATMGASRNPQGHVLGVNSQYLTIDGRPWLPVMGEFHYSRYPEAEWEEEILKMKAAGIQIISTYVIWIHHEQVEGQFDWTGQRDLREFVKLCGKHGMYVYPRIGPWSHAEVRNGGFPDWVLKNGPVRENDPVYLEEVQAFYAEIAKQLKGELWKDGGPVIGIQVENEYREAKPGTGKGSEHIRMLKHMAVSDGLDVPLYTVTGWDGAAIPLNDVLPVYGGYPDAPWDGSNKKLVGNEIYAYRFKNRVAGSMGAIGGRGQNAASSYQGAPFLTAEVGDGGEDTYFRRPVFNTDDIAAIAPVMLGSGVNLLGYYMFHGGLNPDGHGITLEESQRFGDATDVPEKSYDFQAPIGEFGQVRESLLRLKLVHYFLDDFGVDLAPMTARSPLQVPAGPMDTSTVRVAARTNGDHGFLFVNNYVRGLQMPERKNFQVQLQLPHETVNIPEEPIDLPAGTYGIWPVNLPLSAASSETPILLRYSTAQLFKRVTIRGQTYYFFFALPGVNAEFVLDQGAKLRAVTAGVETSHATAGLRLRASGQADVTLDGGVHLVLLPENQAEHVWRGDDSSTLIETEASAFSSGAKWVLQSADRHFHVGIFGAAKPGGGGQPLVYAGRSGLFAQYRASVPELELQAPVKQVQGAKPRDPWILGPTLEWRSKPIPEKPLVSEFANAAVWKIDMPPVPLSAQVSDVWLDIDYQGDEARLSNNDCLLDDNFWNGLPWTIGLRETLPHWRVSPSDLELSVLPLPKSYPLYLEEGRDEHFDASGQALNLTNVRLVPEYQLMVDLSAGQ
jgi:beta-galactosidase